MAHRYLEPHCGRFLRTPLSRREMLARSGVGIGSLALTSLLADDGLLAAGHSTPSLKTRPNAAKSVIFLFMAGGPSQVDSYDPKPLLNELDGKDTPESIRKLFPLTAEQGNGTRRLMGCPFEFKQYGQSGLPVSSLFTETAKHIDDLCVIRSIQHDSVIHIPSEYMMTTGSLIGDRPSFGSWVLYGMGSENKNLPGFVVLGQAPPRPTLNSGFLPARYQGTSIQSSTVGIPNLRLPGGLSIDERRHQLDLIGALNREHLERQQDNDSELEARIRSYELAFRMQAAAPEAFDLTRESEQTQRLYGMDHGNADTREVGAQYLLARRLVERGVRFVQVRVPGWDSHSDLKGGHGNRALATDRPTFGLLEDLKRRGLFDNTLVVWGGEFGRTPGVEGGNGRDHSPGGFTWWFAGGGIRGGQTIGKTDEVGYTAVERPFAPCDMHATMLHALGVDQYDMHYNHHGRRELATFNGGKVVEDAFA